MKETGILMRPELAVLAHQGVKTNTRRLVTLPRWAQACNEDNEFELDGDPLWPHAIAKKTGCLSPIECPWGEAGDRIWVRETWNHSNYPLGPAQPGCSIFYRGDYLDDPLGPDLERSPDGIRRKWLSPLHLFRWASRTVGELTAVKVERVQDISEADMIAEGMTVDRVAKWCNVPWSNMPTLFDAWRVYWTMLHGRESWEANPWVWSLHFRKVDAAAA